MQALMVQPKCYTAHIIKGIALRLTDKSAESEQAFKEALRLNPRRLEAYKG